MNAIQYIRYGPPVQLRRVDLPVPEPGRRELLVRVAFGSVNPLDWRVYDGGLRWFMPARFPGIPGFDLAGTVAALGSGVTEFHHRRPRLCAH